MVFQLDFKGPYHNIRMRLGSALIVCDLYDLFLHSGHFSVEKSEAFQVFLCYFGLKIPFSRSLNVILLL